MHQTACFWTPFGSERVNESQKLSKSLEKYFYPTFSLFWAKLSLKKFFLIRSEILGLLESTLPASYDNSRINRENIPLPIQIKWSKEPEIFCCIFFFCIFGIYIKFPMFWKQIEPHRSSISEVIDSKRCAYLKE